MKTRKELEARKEAFQLAINHITDFSDPGPKLRRRIKEIEHVLEE